MKNPFKKGYAIEGKERENLADLLRTMVALQGQFSALIQFIARREGLNLEQLTFDADKLAFIPRPAADPKV